MRTVTQGFPEDCTETSQTEPCIPSGCSEPVDCVYEYVDSDFCCNGFVE